MAQDFVYESMGTKWKISIGEDLSLEKFKELEEKVVKASQDFDRTYSRFIPQSLISRIATQTGTLEVPNDLVKMLRLYFELYPLTDKKLNPLIGHTISDLGYDATYTLVPKTEVRKTPDLLETIRIIDGTHLGIKEPVLIDLGALGKGYFVDRIAELLEKEGITQYLVDGSGDIRYRGEEKIRVGLEDPRDATKVVGMLDMSTSSMASSGTNRRQWGKYHHVIDPHTSVSTEGIMATWVTAPTCAIADALASAFFFVSPEEIADTYAYEYAIMNSEGRVKRSLGFKAEFY